MVLIADSISLRPFCLEDHEKLLLWSKDMDLRLLALMHPYPITSDHYKQWLTQIMNDTTNKNVFFAAEINSNKEFFGYFQLREINLIHKHAFLGIIIGNANVRGLGYGKEIMNLGLNYGFNMLGLNKISLEVLASNTSATKLYDSFGFIQEGKFMKQFFYNGKWHDVLRMAKFI